MVWRHSINGKGKPDGKALLLCLVCKWGRQHSIEVKAIFPPPSLIVRHLPLSCGWKGSFPAMNGVLERWGQVCPWLKLESNLQVMPFCFICYVFLVFTLSLTMLWSSLKPFNLFSSQLTGFSLFCSTISTASPFGSLVLSLCFDALSYDYLASALSL